VGVSSKKKSERSFYIKLSKLSLESLISNKTRALLTMLGIVIGAATIILVIAMGEGAKRDIDEQFSNMSVTTLLINATSGNTGVKSKLSIDDIESITELEPVLVAVPQLAGTVDVSFGSNFESFNILGSTAEVFPMMGVEFVEGSAFTNEDDNDHAKVAVVGANIVEELFKDEETGEIASALGEEINVGGKSFEIIGVLAYKGGSIGPTSIDGSVFMPYTSAFRYVLGSKGKFTINALATNIETLDWAMEDISSLLRKNHNIRSGGLDDFKVRDMGSNVQAAKDSARTMSLLLGSVGLVVLIVGGIGIMNIMYVTVSERTKEIGLRKAIGAKNKHIELQFLMEAVILSVVGFVVGALLATGMFFIIKGLQVSVVLVWWSYLLSLVFVMMTGVFFGYAPAKKAALLHPIEALRHE